MKVSSVPSNGNSITIFNILALSLALLSSFCCEASLRSRTSSKHVRTNDEHESYRTKLMELQRRLQPQPQQEVSASAAVATPDNDNNSNNNDRTINCQEELSLEVLCREEEESVCNDLSTKHATCESKLFRLHGGLCRSSSTIMMTSETTAPRARQPFVEQDSDIDYMVLEDCQDFHGGLPALDGVDVYVVISDPNDPLQNTSMWTTVGEYFWTDYQDYPTGHYGLPDVQNITFYSTDEGTAGGPSFDNMLQTMLFRASCESFDNGLSTPNLQRPTMAAAAAPVQLVGTAVDPQIYVHFEIRITNNIIKKDATTEDRPLKEEEEEEEQEETQWNIHRLTVATTVVPPYEVLDLQPIQRVVKAVTSIPYRVEMDRSEHLSILSTAVAVNAQTGQQCHINGLFNVPSRTTTTAA